MTFGLQERSHSRAIQQVARRLFPNSAFSLVEVVLAIGVISFALVAIIGLFPVASRSAVESQRETRAALIAQQIVADLRVADGPNRFLLMSTNLTTTNVPLSNAAELFLALSVTTNRPNELTRASISGQTFTNGSTDINHSFVARLSVQTNTGLPRLSRIETTIEAPAAARSTNRSSYTFVTLMNY